MTVVYQPDPTFVTDIIAALAEIARTQVAGINTIWEQPPDGSPEDGDLIFPSPAFAIKGNTNGKLYLSLKFSMRYVIRRGDLSADMLQAYSYITPFLLAYSAWGNQQLGGLCQEINVNTGGVTQSIFSGINMICLLINLEVLLDYNIPTS